MSKINLYITANLRNAAYQAGVTVASWTTRSGLYAGALSAPPITVYDNYTDKLMVDGKGNVNSVVLEADGSRIEIIDAIIDVKKENDIKATPLVARNGTVKERIQEKDYSVTISGSLFGERDKFPYYELQLLNAILSVTKSISVASSYLCIFDIDRLVLRDANFEQKMLKHFNVMPFTLKFDSDTDYDFLVMDN